MSASTHRYSCSELGACQSRPTPCAGCDYPYAVTRHRSARRSAQLRELGKWLTVAALLAALSITLGLAAGLITGS